MSQTEANTTPAFFFILFCLILAVSIPQILEYTVLSVSISILSCMWGMFVYYIDTNRHKWK